MVIKVKLAISEMLLLRNHQNRKNLIAIYCLCIQIHTQTLCSQPTLSTCSPSHNPPINHTWYQFPPASSKEPIIAFTKSESLLFDTSLPGWDADPY